jgi:16S rRNA (cytidine1402-2'-O)-methyltransferase
MAALYLVATPIGNLKDISFRALEVLNSVDLVLAEDTRKTGQLLANYREKEPFNQILKRKPQLLSFFEANEEKRIPQVLNLLKQEKKIALVSNAGTPLISDPGFKLVRECIKENIKIEAIPGASASLSALISSGLPPDKFLFLGFLPKKQGKRQKLLKNINKLKKYISPTIIIYASPYRILKELEDIKNEFGSIRIALAKELTKLHEDLKRDKIENIIKNLKQERIKGEFVLVFNLD